MSTLEPKAGAPAITREDQILDLASQGFTDKEIAAELGISRETVATYWKRVRRRMEASSRTEVIAKLLRHENMSAQARMEQLAAELADCEKQRNNLKAGRARLRLILDHLPFGLVLESTERKVLVVNQGFADLFHLAERPQHLSGGDHRDLIRRIAAQFQDGAALFRRLERGAQAGKAVRLPDFKMCSGTPIEIEVRPVTMEKIPVGVMYLYREVLTELPAFA